MPGWAVAGCTAWAPPWWSFIPVLLQPSPRPQVASATNDVAGDGTTTATVLTRAILVEGCKSVAAGMNPMDLRRGINLAVSSFGLACCPRIMALCRLCRPCRLGWIVFL